MEEIIISTQSGSVSCNFEKAKEMLNAELEKYSKMVFTEETKVEAKNTVAELRKGKKAFSDRCKEIKKEYMIPMDEFLIKAGELSDMFDKPIIFINEQIEEFEKKRIAEKKQQIVGIYEEMIPEEDIREYIPLAKIYDSRWENATTTAKSIKEAIMNAKENVKKALDTINPIESDVKGKALDEFKRSLDLASALSIITSYENEKKAILEAERKRVHEEEVERIRKETREAFETEDFFKKAVEQAKEETREEILTSLMPKQEEEAEENVYVYNIFLTEDMKASLEMFMDSVGITYKVREM